MGWFGEGPRGRNKWRRAHENKSGGRRRGPMERVTQSRHRRFLIGPGHRFLKLFAAFAKSGPSTSCFTCGRICSGMMARSRLSSSTSSSRGGGLVSLFALHRDKRSAALLLLLFLVPISAAAFIARGKNGGSLLLLFLHSWVLPPLVLQITYCGAVSPSPSTSLLSFAL